MLEPPVALLERGTFGLAQSVHNARPRQVAAHDALPLHPVGLHLQLAQLAPLLLHQALFMPLHHSLSMRLRARRWHLPTSLQPEANARPRCLALRRHRVKFET